MDHNTITILSWLGILFCISQSAMFSGLNLALLGISRLRLEVEATTGNHSAARILDLRRDSNLLLTTILWGNVGINVLLTLLADSLLAGVSAFFFSTILITFLGEIVPQAYFSRNAMRMGSLLVPVLKFYQWLLFPVTKPSAWALDKWLGKENISYFRERDIRQVIRKHIEASGSDLDRLEGMGALNFLAIDDLMVSQEGEMIDPESIISLEFDNYRPFFPNYQADANDPFLKQVAASGKKWVIITDRNNDPQLVLNSNIFLRQVIFSGKTMDPYIYCHQPVIATKLDTLLGKVLAKLEVNYSHEGDDIIDHDLILIWSDEKRVITGADILGRLMRGIAIRK
jgi:hypothetical protein